MDEKQQAKAKTTIKQPPLLFRRTQQILSQLSKTLGGPIMSYWNNPRGAVCHNDSVGLHEILQKVGPQPKIYLFIKSSGGSGEAALRMVNLLRQYAESIVALIPLECASAATMLSIGCNEIHMGQMAYLTAVDTSLTHDLSPVDRDNDRVSVSLDELTRVIRLWRSQNTDAPENPYKQIFQYVHPLVIGAVDRAESLSIMICRELLSYHIKDESQATKIADTLNSKYPSHSFPILFEEALRIGLPVRHLPPHINTLLLHLNGLYSEVGQKATTDFDEIHSHSNEIINILEAPGMQVYRQLDKDWFYRTEERRWITMNDNSSWRRIELKDGKMKKTILHIA